MRTGLRGTGAGPRQTGRAALWQGDRAAGAMGGHPVVDEAEQDEKLPRRPSVSQVALANREVGAEGLAVVWERHLQLGRDRGFLRAGVP